MTTICCPHCDGFGRVSEDFLTEDHVDDVFRDYCEVFDIFHAYGVEKYDDLVSSVRIKQDTSCRGCYDCETHTLPKAYFTRNQAKRLELMREDLAKKEAVKREQDLSAKRDQLVQHELAAARLREELS